MRQRREILLLLAILVGLLFIVAPGNHTAYHGGDKAGWCADANWSLTSVPRAGKKDYGFPWTSAVRYDNGPCLQAGISVNKAIIFDFAAGVIIALFAGYIIFNLTEAKK